MRVMLLLIFMIPSMAWSRGGINFAYEQLEDIYGLDKDSIKKSNKDKDLFNMLENASEDILLKFEGNCSLSKEIPDCKKEYEKLIMSKIDDLNPIMQKLFKASPQLKKCESFGALSKIELNTKSFLKKYLNGKSCSSGGCMPEKLLVCYGVVECTDRASGEKEIVNASCSSTTEQGCPSAYSCVGDTSVTAPEELFQSKPTDSNGGTAIRK